MARGSQGWIARFEICSLTGFDLSAFATCKYSTLGMLRHRQSNVLLLPGSSDQQTRLGEEQLQNMCYTVM